MAIEFGVKAAGHHPPHRIAHGNGGVVDDPNGCCLLGAAVFAMKLVVGRPITP